MTVKEAFKKFIIESLECLGEMSPFIVLIGMMLAAVVAICIWGH